MPSLPERECENWDLHNPHKYRHDDRDHMCPGNPSNPPLSQVEKGRKYIMDTYGPNTTRDAADTFLRSCGIDPSPEAIDRLVENFLPSLRIMSDGDVAYEEVNHPAHYGGDTPYEVIKVLEAWCDMFGLPVNITSAIKYLSRAGRKPGVTTEKDLRKAAWHINREIERNG